MNTVIYKESDFVKALTAAAGDIVIGGHLARTFRIRYAKAVTLSRLSSRIVCSSDVFAGIRGVLLYTRGVRLDMFVLELMLGNELARLVSGSGYVRMRYLLGGNIVFMRQSNQPNKIY